MSEHIDVVQTDPGIALSLALDSQIIAMGIMCWRGGIRADLIQKEVELNCTSLEGEHHLV